MKTSGQWSKFYRLNILKFFSTLLHPKSPKKRFKNRNHSNQNNLLIALSILGKPLYLLLSTSIIALFGVVFLLSRLIRLPHLLIKKLRFPRFKLTNPLHKLTLPRPKLVIPTFKLSLPKFKFVLPPLKLSPLFLFFIISISISIGSFYYWILKDLPSPYQLAILQPKLTTQIFDRNGSLIYKIYKDENRTLVKLNDVPLQVQQATLAIEDKDFYQHQGFSLRGIARAIKRNITTNEVQGGSTITQQLIKNTLLTNDKTLTRKVKEIILAIHTELIFDKNQIFEMYLNQVSYGGTIYGIQEAAQQYFGKNISELNLAEATLLAGLPQAPTRYSPFAHPELAKQRQKIVLERMVTDGHITPDQAEVAAQTPLHFRSSATDILAPHFVMYVRDLLVEQYGEETVQHGGLQVHTTLDLSLQQKAQSIVTKEVDKLAPLRVSNGAALITNPKNGEILAMVGSKDYFDFNKDGQVNLTTSLRQPGSSVKPFNYALAFEKGYSPASIISDSPITFNSTNSTPWIPKNYDGKFHGNVTLRTALASSYNIPAVKLLSTNGINQMVDLAHQMGINTWNDPSRFGLSLTLGSLEVKMTEMAQAYGTFANLGENVPLTPIISITDSQGKTLPFNPCPTPTPISQLNQAQAAESCQTKQILSPQTAYLISDILSDNVARSPAFGSRSVLNIPNHQVAVKTGTSNDLRDNWTVGYTPNILVSTWVGNNDNSPMSQIASGVTGASPIWAQIMISALSDKPKQTFTIPDNLVKVTVCTLTGTLTCSACPSTKVEVFTKGNEPKTACNNDQIKKILEEKQKQLDLNNSTLTTQYPSSKPLPQLIPGHSTSR